MVPGHSGGQGSVNPGATGAEQDHRRHHQLLVFSHAQPDLLQGFPGAVADPSIDIQQDSGQGPEDHGENHRRHIPHPGNRGNPHRHRTYAENDRHGLLQLVAQLFPDDASDESPCHHGCHIAQNPRRHVHVLRCFSCFAPVSGAAPPPSVPRYFCISLIYCSARELRMLFFRSI